MKPFIASKFISNQETPVIARKGKPIEIITVKGRGKQPVVGYVEGCDTPYSWCLNGMYSKSNTEDPWDLFFAPKIEVVHVYQSDRDPKGCYVTVHSSKFKEYAGITSSSAYTYLGTITGPIVPPEEGK